MKTEQQRIAEGVLLTDQYQLTMAQLYYRLGLHEHNAQFDHFFRSYPDYGQHQSGYCIADVYPDDCLLLVDTIDTLESGVPNAIRVFEELKEKGHQPVGIRLDSGDLAHLSIQAARMLNQAGFQDARIVLSNQLDELVIWQIMTQIKQEAGQYGVEPEHLIERLIFGVGTHLITSDGNPALDGVYKLVAIEQEDEWVPAIKISENPAKIPEPGHKHAWRIYDDLGKATADLLSLANEDLRQRTELHLQHPHEQNIARHLKIAEISQIEPLLTDIQIEGKVVYGWPELKQIRSQRNADLERLDPGVCRIMNPHSYHVSVTQSLWELKQELIAGL